MTIPVTPAETLNAQPEPRIQNVLATGNPIAVLLGTCTATAQIFAAHYDLSADRWTLGVLWGYGQVADIRDVRFNGDDLADVTLTHYVGMAGQSVDATLRSEIDGYHDDMILRTPTGSRALAYSVVQYLQEDYALIPTVTATVEGLPGTQNPINAARFLIEDPVIGLGESVVEASWDQASRRCNEFVDGQEPRHRIGLILDQDRPALDWIQTLAEYAHAYVFRSGARWDIRVNAPSDVDRLVTDQQWLQKSLQIERNAPSESPTAVEVRWTDLSTGLPHTRAVRVSHPDTPVDNARVSSVAMPGITRFSEARRYATTRFNLLQHRRRFSWSGRDPMLDVEIGDVVHLQSEKLEVDEIVRVIDTPSRTRDGQVNVVAQRYDAADYDDSIRVQRTVSYGGQVYGISQIPDDALYLADADAALDWEPSAADYLTLGGQLVTL